MHTTWKASLPYTVEMQRFVISNSDLKEIAQEQYVWACQLSIKRSIRKDNGERLRWQAQEYFCCVPSCSSVFLEEELILVD